MNAELPNQGQEREPTALRVKTPGEELLDLIARQAAQVPFAVFGVLIIIAALILPYSPTGALVWLTAVAVVLAIRYFVLGRLPRVSRLPLIHKLNLVVLLSLLNGATHASSLIFFSAMTDLEKAIQSLILAGLATGAVATTAGDRRVYFAYILPIFIPLIMLWATTGHGTTPTRTGIGLALSVVVFLFVLVIVARDTRRQFRETIDIRRAQEETNRQLQLALQAAGVADRAKTRFLASASHDLRQPIHALSLFGAALKMQQLPAGARELAENIDESISVLASQLDALLDISKLDAGVVKPDLSVIDLSAMLQRIAREFEPQVNEKGLVLVTDIRSGCFVSSDKLLLERVVRNLLNNALRYTEQGSITIRLVASGPNCLIVIEDTGIGIPDSEQDKIFSEFYQVANKRSASKQGLGLGLSIVTRLLSLLGIPLRLDSVPGEGTRLELALVLEEEQQAAAEAFVMARLEGIRILVVDDDTAVRAAMMALLRSFGAAVDAVPNGTRALASARASMPDLVLTDLRLDEESGLDVIQSLRNMRADLPAILLTGDTGAEQIREVHDFGVEVLHKPVGAADLERKIAEVLHGPVHQG
ncbi:MAG: hybrid sensor histidine kinase/response regulator [Pseudomonadota bacterium]